MILGCDKVFDNRVVKLCPESVQNYLGCFYFIPGASNPGPTALDFSYWFAGRMARLFMDSLARAVFYERVIRQ